MAKQKCLLNENWAEKNMKDFDNLGSELREAIRNSKYNLCVACIVLKMNLIMYGGSDIDINEAVVLAIKERELEIEKELALSD